MARTRSQKRHLLQTPGPVRFRVPVHRARASTSATHPRQRPGSPAVSLPCQPRRRDHFRRRKSHPRVPQNQQRKLPEVALSARIRPKICTCSAAFRVALAQSETGGELLLETS
uniref:(northern house mosquito) hypothetical protein n=1 Tax=Culex pipiens TaxID=7175 RepID=A0A8D8JQH1_CULPI